MTFKTSILQKLYGRSDAQTEFQILNRCSFRRFLDLDDGDDTPDETTIWRFREALVRSNAIEPLFARFDTHLKGLGYLAMGGQIMDASIIAAPRQRMIDAERTIVKEGGILEDWAAKPAKLDSSKNRLFSARRRYDGPRSAARHRFGAVIFWISWWRAARTPVFDAMCAQ